MGAGAWSTYVVYGVIYLILIFVRIFLLRELINLDPWDFIKKVMLPYIPVVCMTFIAPTLVVCFMDEGVIRLLITCALSVLWTTTIVYTVGLTKSERTFIYEKYLKRIIKK